MITVRFPSGFSIQYNAAQKVEAWGGMIRILDAGKKDVALVPLGSVIEFASPCRTYNPIATDSDKVQASVELLRKEVRSLTRKIAKK